MQETDLVSSSHLFYLKMKDIKRYLLQKYVEGESETPTLDNPLTPSIKCICKTITEHISRSKSVNGVQSFLFLDSFSLYIAFCPCPIVYHFHSNKTAVLFTVPPLKEASQGLGINALKRSWNRLWVLKNAVSCCPSISYTCYQTSRTQDATSPVDLCYIVLWCFKLFMPSTENDLTLF